MNIQQQGQEEEEIEEDMTVEEDFQDALKRELTLPQPSQFHNELNFPKYLAADNQSSQISTRQQGESSGEESLSSQASTSKRTKKGWPKGKPRKIGVGKLPPPQTPLPQGTGTL
ncbi:hypothetical protein JTB14_002931 [Gonioctena quinquepunctata]|nr:hypothetical protein JTB14_002931 [Gonioctena quinquepunctata]